MAAAPARAPTPAAAPAPRGKISAATRIYLAQRARAEMARRSLYEFLVQAWPELEPGVPFEDNWHLHAFCFHVQSMLEGWLIANGHGTKAMRARVRASWHANGLDFTPGELLVQNLIMNLPPSTLKSRILMVVAPAWMWLHCATWSVCAISAVDDNVRRDSNAHRELVQSKWYRDTFEIHWKIKDGSKQPDGSKLAKSDAVGDWATTAGGERKSRTMLGQFTGIHADCVAAGTLIATEIGDLPVETLVAMPVLPRVWSMNHATGRAELQRVRATRTIPGRPVVDVRVNSGEVVRCTDDHRVWTSDGYLEACKLEGRSVLVLRQPEPASAAPGRQAEVLRRVLAGDLAVQDVRPDVHQSAGGSREDGAEGETVRPILFEGVPAHEPRWPSEAEDVRHVPPCVQGDGKGLLLEEVSRRLAARSPASDESVRALPEAISAEAPRQPVLLDGLQERGALGGYARIGERELSRHDGRVQRVDRADGGSDQAAGREPLHGVQARTGEAWADGASHRRGSLEQQAHEPDHVVRRLPQHAPQGIESAVSSVTPVLEDGRRAAVAVYDLDVEGNHNFFAGSILVHNCLLLDDPDDANKVHGEAKRKEVQNTWSRAIKNRVKHPERSMRIAIQQRVHVDDWTAAQVSKGQWSPEDRKAWAWVVMPLEFGHAPQGAPVVSPWGWRDPRSVANDNMQATRFTPAVIADEQRDKGPEGFEAQYNQNPSSYDAGMIKRAYVRFFRIAGDPIATRARPHGCGIREDGTPEEALVLGRDPGSGLLDVDFITVSVDASGGSERLTASQVGIVVVAGKGLQRFVLDDRSDVMGPQAQIDAVAQVLADYPAETCLVELKALGASVIETISNMVADGKIVDAGGRPRVVVVEAIKVEPGDTKESRAHAMLPAWRQGLWFVRDGAPWLYPKVIDGGRVVDAGFIGEVCAFPKSKRSDRVDALSQLDAFHRDGGDELGRWRAMSRPLLRR